MVALALAAGACTVDGVSSEARCVEHESPFGWMLNPDPVCGEGPDHYYGEDEDGAWFTGATCTDAWSAECSGPRQGWFTHTGEIASACTEVGPAPACPDGSAPRCVLIPCDGETYYGPDHPMAQD